MRFIFLVLLLVISGSFALSNAFADHSEVTIVPADGSGAPGCEETADGCYIPTTATVNAGGVVIMSNTDTAAHTFTSGTPADGPDGNFDTSLLMAGSSFEWSPDTVGEYPYFCMVHPWMIGSIVVQEVGSEEAGEHEELTTMIKGMSEDGSVNIDIMTTDPTAGEEMTIVVEFSKATGEEQKHMNYDIVVTQNGNQVLSEKEVHLMESNAKHTTNTLGSDDPVDVTITLLGIGMSAPYTGPIGEIVQFNVVPEFGTIAVIILGVAITSVVVLSTKSKVIPRF